MRTVERQCLGDADWEAPDTTHDCTDAIERGGLATPRGGVEGSPWTSALGVVPGRTEEEGRRNMADWLMGVICDKFQSPCKVMERKGWRK